MSVALFKPMKNHKRINLCLFIFLVSFQTYIHLIVWLCVFFWCNFSFRLMSRSSLCTLYSHYSTLSNKVLKNRKIWGRWQVRKAFSSFTRCFFFIECSLCKQLLRELQTLCRKRCLFRPLFMHLFIHLSRQTNQKWIFLLQGNESNSLPQAI